METYPIFSVGIGKAQELDLLPIARQLFNDNKNVLAKNTQGFLTTLITYGATQNCSVLKNKKAVSVIKNAIQQNAIKFYADLGFNTDKLQFEVINFWLNEMTSGSTHGRHAHYGYQVSGCFYVDVPNNSNVLTLFSPLENLEHGLSLPTKNFTPYTATHAVQSVNEGDMFFWGSLLKHEVPALNFEGIRRSIAFDISISVKPEKTEIYEEAPLTYKANLKDYVAIYNINDLNLCKKLIEETQNSLWEKHTYNNPITNTNSTFDDDLDVILHGETENLKALEKIFKLCVKEYVETVSFLPMGLQKITPIRRNRYSVGTNMKPHFDHIHTIFDGEHKGVPVLTILALLNDDFEGGDFVMFDNEKVKLSAGDIIIFPSTFLYPHAVTDVTKGTRYSCVAWGF